MRDTVEAIVASPPDKNGLVVQLFSRGKGQWAEIDQEEGLLVIEVYAGPDGKALRFDLEEVERVITLAKERLR